MSRKIFLNLKVALDNLSSEDIDENLALIPLNIDGLIDESKLDKKILQRFQVVMYLVL